MNDDSACYQVGDLVVDVRRERVTREGREIPLAKLTFDVLLALVRAAPDTVGFDDLMQRGWPGLVVGLDTVSQRVKKLRSALDDDAKEPRYIAGVRGRGYRVCAPVVRFDPAENADVSAAKVENAPAILQARLLRRGTVFATAALLVLVALAGTSWLSHRYPAASDTMHITAVAPTPPARSIAVLPFVNLSGASDEDYFADGFSEEILDSLSRVKGLHVAASTSSFLFKTQKADVATVARRLNVHTVLEGDVRRSGDRIRITAHLVDAKSGFRMWSGSYDRNLGDVLTLQTEIAAQVTRALTPALLDDTGLDKRYATGSPRGFDLYLRGRSLSQGSGEASTRAALAAIDQALALDPKFVFALVERSSVLTTIAGAWIRDASEIRNTYQDARRAAETAIGLAPELGEAHAVYGRVLAEGFLDLPAADRELSQALQLAPGNVRVQRVYSAFAGAVGKAQPAIEAAEQTVDLDPLNGASYRALGIALFRARRFDEALDAFHRARILDIHDTTYAAWAGLAELFLGRPERAREECGGQLDWGQQTCLIIALHRLGRRDEAAALLQKLQATMGSSLAYQYAQIHAQMGQSAPGLASLETAYRLRDPGIITMETDPLLDPLRYTREFAALETKLQFSTFR